MIDLIEFYPDFETGRVMCELVSMNDSSLMMEITDTYVFSKRYPLEVVIEEYVEDREKLSKMLFPIHFTQRAFKFFGRERFYEMVKAKVKCLERLVKLFDQRREEVDGLIYRSSLYKKFEFLRYSPELEKAYWEWDPYEGYFHGQGIPFETWIAIVEEKVFDNVLQKS